LTTRLNKKRPPNQAQRIEPLTVSVMWYELLNLLQY
jgi:hypothetical protein